MQTFSQFVESKTIPYDTNPFDSLKGRPVVVFATETTGFSPREAQVTELAARALDGDSLEPFDTYNHHAILGQDVLDQIKRQETEPPTGKYAKTIQEILAMTNYYNKRAKLSEAEVLQGFVEWVPEGCVIVGHNAEFDLRMVNTRCVNLGLPKVSGFAKVLDTNRMAQQFFVPASQELEDSDPEAKRILDRLTKQFTKKGKRQRVSTKLGDLADALGVKLDNWHEGLADVDATIGILQQFKTFFDKHHGSGVERLPDFQRRYRRARHDK